MPKAPRGPRSPRRTAAGMGSLRGGVDARSEAAAPASTARATPTAAAGIPPLASASQVSAAPQEGSVIEPRTQTGQAPRRETDEPSAAARFHIFIVDSGWNSPAHRVLVENFALIRNLQKDDPIYVLSREQSIAFQRHHASRIGRDPIIAVHDMEALDKGGTVGFHGFRLSLGLLRTPQQALLGLQAFVRFLVTHRRSTDLEADIRANLRREGLMGAIEIIMHHEAREIGG
jgi:hypothetical protein